MKSIRNLIRMAYETTSFLGWRLALSNNGTIFTKYFSDKVCDDAKQSFASAQAGVNEILANAKLVSGKHTATTIRKVEKMQEQA